MGSNDLMAWFGRYPDQKRVIGALNFPLVVKRIARTSDLEFRRCLTVLESLKEKQLVQCLNPEMSSGRVYWLTPRGRRLYRLLAPINTPSLPKLDEIASVDWNLYGWLSFRHNGAVFETLSATGDAISVPEIRRRALKRNSELCMGIEHARAVVKKFLKLGLIECEIPPKSSWPVYRLSKFGKEMKLKIKRGEGMSG